MDRWKKKLQELFGIDIRSLAFFRMGLALVLIGDLLNRIQDLIAHYTDDGVLPRDVLIYHFLDPWHFSLHLMNGSWGIQFLLFSLAILFAIGLLFGFYTRLSTILSWLLLISLHTRNPLLVHGGDTLLRMLLFWGMFLPLGAYWSVDRWKGQQQKYPFQIISGATYALLLQVCMMYWVTALLKTDVAWRQEGTAVWYVFSNEFFATRIARFLLDYPTLLQTLTFSTLFLEFFGPLFVFLPIWTTPIRTTMVVIFMFFHLVLGLTLELGIFSYVAAVAWIPFLPGGLWNVLLGSFPEQVVKLRSNKLLYRVRLDCINLDSARQSQSDLTEEDHCRVGKADEEDQFGKARASPNLYNLTERGINCLALFFFLYIVLWNLRSVGAISLPPQFNAIASLTRIDQHWNMFAPFPLRDHGWFLIPGTLRNGKEIDLYTHQALNWQKPDLCSACFKNDRWRSFMLNLVFDDKSPISLANYAGYLWQNWNDTHPYEEHLLSLDIVLISKKNGVGGSSSDYDKFTLWKHEQ